MSKKRVLLVEDSAAVRKLVGPCLLPIPILRLLEKPSTDVRLLRKLLGFDLTSSNIGASPRNECRQVDFPRLVLTE